MASLLKYCKPLLPLRLRRGFASKSIYSKINFHSCFPFSPPISCCNSRHSLTTSSGKISHDSDKYDDFLMKELRLFNTMTKRNELFKSKVEGKVGMYVCGVTSYDLSHIGHARVYVAFDVLYRYILLFGVN